MLHRSSFRSPVWGLQLTGESRGFPDLDPAADCKVYDRLTMLIGALAKRAGVKPQTIRYYETLGLLPRPVRTASGYRRYESRALDELAFIRKAQHLGFSLDDIQQILWLGRAGKAPCSSVLSLAEGHLTELDERIEQLTHLRGELGRAVQRWRDGGVPERCVSTLCGLIADATVPHTPNRQKRSGLPTTV